MSHSEYLFNWYSRCTLVDSKQGCLMDVQLWRSLAIGGHSSGKSRIKWHWSAGMRASLWRGKCTVRERLLGRTEPATKDNSTMGWWLGRAGVPILWRKPNEILIMVGWQPKWLGWLCKGTRLQMEDCLKTASIIRMATTGALATRLSLMGSLSSELHCLAPGLVRFSNHYFWQTLSLLGNLTWPSHHFMFACIFLSRYRNPPPPAPSKGGKGKGGYKGK